MEMAFAKRTRSNLMVPISCCLAFEQSGMKDASGQCRHQRLVVVLMTTTVKGTDHGKRTDS